MQWFLGGLTGNALAKANRISTIAQEQGFVYATDLLRFNVEHQDWCVTEMQRRELPCNCEPKVWAERLVPPITIQSHKVQ